MRAIFATALLLIPTPVLADDRWRKLEIAWQAANAADFATTEYCLRRDTCHEANPILGKHPSTGELAAFKIGSGAAHYLIAREIARHDAGAAHVFEVVTLIVQGGIVGANLRFVF